MTQVQAHENIEAFEMMDVVESSEGSEIEFIEADIVEMEVSIEEELPAVPPELSPDDIRLVEAILFASTAAIDERAIEERFPADRAAVIPEALEHLREQYAARGVNLVQRDKRWAFRTASDLGDQMRLEKDQQKKFTRAAMETLAIIGYHQPVTRAEIENIRGVATSAGALDTLMEAGWIKLGKRREVVGRPVTWQTTQGFLDHFGLTRLEDLPGMEDLKAAGLLDKRPAIEAMPTTSDLFDEKMDIGAEPITDEDLMGKLEEERDEALEIEIELEPDIELNLDSELNDEEEKI